MSKQQHWIGYQIDPALPTPFPVVSSGRPTCLGEARIDPGLLAALLARAMRGESVDDADVLERNATDSGNDADMRGQDLLDLGAGSNLPLSREMARRGARVWAVDPALAGEGAIQRLRAPSMQPRPSPQAPTLGPAALPPTDPLSLPIQEIRIVPTTVEALAAAPPAEAPFDGAVARMFLGYPLRSRVKRELFRSWALGRRTRERPPAEGEILRQAKEAEARIFQALEALLRPGAPAVLHSLEHQVFGTPGSGWEVLRPMRPLTGREPAPQSPREWLARQLAGVLILRRR